MVKKLLLVIVLVLFASMAFAWISSGPPEGHLESAGKVDGAIYATATTSISDLQGTAHNGGTDQANANIRGIVYTVYKWRDVNRNSAADIGDEPTGSTTLDGNINDSVGSIDLIDARMFRPTGCIKIGTEIIYYTGKSTNQLTGCVRGYNESVAAAHNNTDAIVSIQVWEIVVNVVCDGSPYDVLGWDAGQGADDGTEGDLLRGGTITVAAGEYWLLKLRVIDGNGNTNTEVLEVDVFATYGADAYVGADGDPALGLKDSAVWQFRVNKLPR